jgi:8-oxo-dGTP diphosphatase
MAAKADEPGLYLGAAFAFVFNAQGEFLLLREGGKQRKYLWDLPGGTLERDEPPLQGLHREVLEETGLTIELLHSACMLKYDRHESDYPILVAFYLARATSGPVELSSEHVEYRWITPQRLQEERITLPPSEEFVSVIFQMYYDTFCGQH